MTTDQALEDARASISLRSASPLVTAVTRDRWTSWLLTHAEAEADAEQHAGRQAPGDGQDDDGDAADRRDQQALYCSRCQGL